MRPAVSRFRSQTEKPAGSRFSYLLTPNEEGGQCVIDVIGVLDLHLIFSTAGGEKQIYNPPTASFLKSISKLYINV